MIIKKIKGRNVSEEKDVAPAPEKKVPALEEPATVLEGVNTAVITTATWSLCRLRDQSCRQSQEDRSRGITTRDLVCRVVCGPWEKSPCGHHGWVHLPFYAELTWVSEK